MSGASEPLDLSLPKGVGLAIHGGAGPIGGEALSPARQQTLFQALRAAARVLAAGGPALEATLAAVVILEDSPLFNAGRGSVLTDEGTVEMDAAIMTGDGRAGAVTGVQTVQNPVLLARAVLEHSPHLLLAGAGAERLAQALGLPRRDPAWFRTALRQEQLQEARARGTTALDHDTDAMGTVGAVARDATGQLAAATSTGGMANKWIGRVGDTPILGAGTWAAAHCAVSATGKGEAFIRGAVGARIAAWMEMGGLSLEHAAHRVVHQELAPGTGGVIAVDHRGQVALPFNSAGMLRGWVEGERLRVDVEG